ncbi:hypothetical protein SLE2022_298250 [Rubroshorea leprosula]
MSSFTHSNHSPFYYTVFRCNWPQNSDRCNSQGQLKGDPEMINERSVNHRKTKKKQISPLQHSLLSAKLDELLKDPDFRNLYNICIRLVRIHGMRILQGSDSILNPTRNLIGYYSSKNDRKSERIQFEIKLSTENR